MTLAFGVAFAAALCQPAIIGEQTKKTPAGGMAEDHFGFSVAVSGDIAVVGAATADPGGVSGAGAVYVFERSGGSWDQIATLTASDGVIDDAFGASVNIVDDTIVVGQPQNLGATPGAAYVFVRPGGGWEDMTEAAKLTASDGANEDLFGLGVAMTGETIVVGARAAGAMDQGAAYVFVKPGGGWADSTETARLTASDADEEDQFGQSVGIEGDTVVVGAVNDGNTGPGNTDGAGAAYVFEKPAAGWSNITETAKLTAEDGDSTDLCGFRVAIHGGTVVAGAPNDGNSGPGIQDGSGSAYVFIRPESGWADATHDAKLIYSDPEPNGFFGFYASILNDRILIGAANRFHTPMVQDGEGAAYLFVEPEDGWSGTLAETEELLASDGLLKRTFGTCVELSEDWAVVGAPGAGAGDTEPGAIYFFAIDNDEDGVANHADNCPDDAAKLDEGICGCGVEDVDGDGDGIFDCADNCAAVANALQEDADADGVGDACDDAGATVPGQCCGGGLPAMLPLMLLAVKRRNVKTSKRRN